MVHLAQDILGCAVQAVVQGRRQVQGQERGRVDAAARNRPRVAATHRRDDQERTAAGCQQRAHGMGNAVEAFTVEHVRPVWPARSPTAAQWQPGRARPGLLARVALVVGQRGLDEHPGRLQAPVPRWMHAMLPALPG